MPRRVTLPCAPQPIVVPRAATSADQPRFAVVQEYAPGVDADGVFSQTMPSPRQPKRAGFCIGDSAKVAIAEGQPVYCKVGFARSCARAVGLCVTARVQDPSQRATPLQVTSSGVPVYPDGGRRDGGA
jgi:hypothetical protein